MTILLAYLAATAAVDPPICTDRPAKANAVCTVPPGRWQLESNLAAWSLTSAGGVQAKILTLGAVVVKAGLSSQSDLQLAVTPYISVKSTGSRGVSGVGDLVVRYKQRLTADNAAAQVAIIPFFKLPVAKRPLGNRRTEGGVAVPTSFAAGRATLTLGPEADLLADADGRGRHLALVNLVNFAGPMTSRITLAGELWSNLNLDPAGTVLQASADAALAYAIGANLQIDAGGNFGLTRATPDIEAYVGLSSRF